MENITANRRYDIDWLRVITIGLLLIYHIGIGFQPWGVLILFIQNNQSLEWLWALMAMLNVWRIPILFFVSGMGVCFAIRKRNWKQLIAERVKRILLPLVFGIIAIVPLHIIIWQKYYNQDISYKLTQGHLWFLANIFAYAIMILPLIIYLKKNDNPKLIGWLKRLYSTPIGLISISALFLIEAYLLKPEHYTFYALSLHGFALGFIAFFLGFSFIITGETFWNTVRKWKWLYLAISLLMYVVRAAIYSFEAPNFYVSIESVMWILAIFGLGNQYLNKPSNILSYLSQAVYPIYIIHMVFLYLSSYYLFPLSIPTNLKLVLSILLTTFGCYILYEFLIRRVKILRMVFGLKHIKN